MIGRAKILYARKLKLEEQLEKMIEIAESQIRVIKVVSSHSVTNAHLSPQLQAIEEAKKVLGEVE